jgi:bifunctional non-homologous end joining protein LigD
MPLVWMLATLTDCRDFGEDWLLERKFDGERCVARKDGSEVRLESRTAKDLTGTYPEVRAAVGVTNPCPERLAAYPVAFCVFDPLELDGDDLRDRPLIERRARLAEAVVPTAGLQQSEAWTGDSQQRFAQSCRAGWEGLIAKRAQALYVQGRWTRPELVAQVAFAEWTNDGRLRQPRFLGLRDDKRPGQVVRERAR